MLRLERDEAEAEALLSDSVYGVLGNERRRYVLYLLTQEDCPLDISTLAERVAGLENDCPVAEVTYDQRKSVYTGLYQNHLPMMEEAGLVRSKNGWERIELTDRGFEIQRRIDSDDGQLDIKKLLCVALMGFGVGLSFGVWSGAPALVPKVGFAHGVIAGLSLFAVGYVLMK